MLKKKSKKDPIPNPNEKIEYSRSQSSGFIGLFLPKKGRKLRTNRYIFTTCLIVLLLFSGMLAYMIHFMIKDAPTVITNPYNQRTENLKKQVIRGEILSADHEILAQTSFDDDGNEIRSYPYDEIFSHVVGYSNHGKAGLEAAYNYELLTSHADIMSQIENGISSKKNPGDKILTTLDTHLQEVAYKALGDYKGAIIALEPSTGKIRAMVSKPVFNPNGLDDIWSDIITDDSDDSVLLNRCTQGLYPPGSTYKVITALEYILEHKYSYNDFQYDCNGETVVNSVRIHCYKEEEHGEENLEEAFANSCNTAFVTLGSELDRKQYIKLNNLLMFNKRIDSDLPISKSYFDITTRSDKSDLPQTVIGQGNILMSPMHNALIMAAIANHGLMMKPMFVDEIESHDGVTVKKYTSHTLLDLTESQEEIAALQKMLRKVVTDGTAQALDTEDYEVYGKTGTAENEKEKAHSWFVGYCAKENPDLVVCVIAENAGNGSKYAVPMAKKVFDAFYDQ